MKVAVFGGSGFLGYAFVRAVLAAGGVEPVIYAGAAGNLSNVARHGLDIRLYDAAAPALAALDADVATVVNFSHPFETRGGISGREQVERFAAAMGAARRSHPGLRLLHVSSMSVYEPFAPGREFDEDSPLAPPRGDRYAVEKCAAERALRALPDAEGWQLHLRPTVVYGPFGGVWTDRLFEAFRAGDVPCGDLGGCIQPVHADDVAGFMLARLRDGTSGTFNLPGPERLTWRAFLEVFGAIVGRGALRPVLGSAAGGAWAFYRDNLGELLGVIRREPSFDRMAVRIAGYLPQGSVGVLRRLLFGRAAGVRPLLAPAMGAASSPYLRPFFAEDRLVDGRRVASMFADYRPRSLAQARAALAAYYRYRFSNERFT